MSFMTKTKSKSFLRTIFCCEVEEEDEQPRYVIGAPTNFRQVDIRLDVLSEADQAMIRQKAHAVANRMFENMRPIQRYDGTTAPSTVPTTVSRVKAHTRQLSNSLLSGNKNAGYEALANGSTTTMRGGAEGESPFELRELLKGKGGSVETTTAGCEVEEVDGKTFGHTK